jgi:hypothetical protein
MTEGAKKAARIVVVGLGLLLSCCTNESETKALLGVVAPSTGQTAATETERDDFACQQYGFYPGSKQFADCMKYVGTRRSNSPSPSSR